MSSSGGPTAGGGGGGIALSDLQEAILTLFPGITLTRTFDGANWPALDASLSTDARVAWLMRKADEAHAPPATTGDRTWVRNSS